MFGNRSGNGLWTAGGVIVVLIVVGVYLTTRGDGVVNQGDVAEVMAPSEPAVISGTELPAPKTVEVPQAVQTADDKIEVVVTADQVATPSFDEVRVDASGAMVIAGRADPGARVDVLVDGEVVATSQVDASGAFAALGLLEQSGDARLLTLRVGTGEEAVLSQEEIILAPVAQVPAAPDNVASGNVAQAIEGSSNAPAPTAESGTAQTDTALAEIAQADTAQAETAQTDTAPADIAQTGTVETGTAETGTAETGTAETGTASTGAEKTDVGAVEVPDTSDVAAAQPDLPESPPVLQADTANTSPASVDRADGDSAPSTTVSDLPAAPDATSSEVAVLRSDEAGVTLVPAQPQPTQTVVLDTIGYTDEGTVQLGGRAASGSVEVRAYLNNRAVARLPVDAQGNWRGEIPQVDAGVYTLRVDALSADGAVASRVETPFKREEPEVLAAAIRGADGPVRAVTVQTGDTLWAIARERYGEGLLYVQVFEANRSSIRDPDLIYPGQVFELPED